MTAWIAIAEDALPVHEGAKKGCRQGRLNPQD
jgi:hypothetical protein